MLEPTSFQRSAVVVAARRLQLTRGAGRLEGEVVDGGVAAHEAHEALPLGNTLEHQDRLELRRPAVDKLEAQVAAVQPALLVVQPQAGDQPIVPASPSFRFPRGA